MLMDRNWQQITLLTLLICASTVRAGQDSQVENNAKQWLQRMLASTSALNYQGVFVYIQGQNLEVMSIQHSGANHGEERQYLHTLNGPRREVVVKGNEVICSLPDQQITFNTTQYQRTPFPISLPQDLSSLEQNYDFKMQGEERVANRNTRKIMIEPRDGYRFGYQLWLDTEHAVVLRSALLDEQHNIREQLVFTEFKVLDQIPLQLIKPQFINAASLFSRPATKATLPEPLWQADELPPGFTIMLQQRYPHEQQHIEHIVISDGLATVSVFLEPVADSQSLLEGPTQIDAINAYAMVLDKHQLIAVGEVPMTTVEHIAKAIHRSE